MNTQWRSKGQGRSATPKWANLLTGKWLSTPEPGMEVAGAAHHHPSQPQVFLGLAARRSICSGLLWGHHCTATLVPTSPEACLEG